jgi:hypothetical protein
VATRTEMITYAKQVSYLRDPHKVSVAVFNYFRQKLDTPTINRVLIEKYGRPDRRVDFMCGHPRTGENSIYNSDNSAKCRKCFGKVVPIKRKPAPKPILEIDEKAMEAKARLIKQVCLDIFDLPKNFIVKPVRKTDDELEAISAICMLAKRYGIRWKDLSNIGFCSDSAGQQYKRHGEDLYETSKPFQRLVDACIRQIDA